MTELLSFFSVPCLPDGTDRGWFGFKIGKIDSHKNRGNFCVKSFDIKQKTLDEMTIHCEELSAYLMKKEHLFAKESTLNAELDHLFETRFKKFKKTKLFGVNTNIKGMFYIKFKRKIVTNRNCDSIFEAYVFVCWQFYIFYSAV